MATPDDRAAARRRLQRALDAARQQPLKHLPPKVRALLGGRPDRARRELRRR
jgi:hypothetical protein